MEERRHIDEIPFPSNRAKIFYEDYIEPGISDSLSDAPVFYPKGLPAKKFPLKKPYEQYLKSVSKTSFCLNYGVYGSIIRNISNIIIACLGRKPDHKEITTICSNFVKEYPVFATKFPAHKKLEKTLRRRFNNQEYIMKKKIESSEASSQNSSSTMNSFLQENEDYGQTKIEKYFQPKSAATRPVSDQNGPKQKRLRRECDFSESRVNPGKFNFVL